MLAAEKNRGFLARLPFRSGHPRAHRAPKEFGLAAAVGADGARSSIDKKSSGPSWKQKRTVFAKLSGAA